MATPAPYDFTLYRGDDFDELTFYVRDLDGNIEGLPEGTTGAAQIRTREGELIATFDVTVEGDRTRLFMPGERTQDLAVGTYRWDVQLQDADGGNKRTPLAGKVKIATDVTR